MPAVPRVRAPTHVSRVGCLSEPVAGNVPCLATPVIWSNQVVWKLALKLQGFPVPGVRPTVRSSSAQANR